MDTSIFAKAKSRHKIINALIFTPTSVTNTHSNAIVFEAEKVQPLLTE
jgi:hypothetical protein